MEIQNNKYNFLDLQFMNRNCWFQYRAKYLLNEYIYFSGFFRFLLKARFFITVIQTIFLNVDFNFQRPACIICGSLSAIFCTTNGTVRGL